METEDIMNKHERATDPAALAAAVLAGALSVFLAPGPYSYFSLVIGFTLLTLLIGYEWPKVRNWGQSIAFSTVLSLCATLVFAVLVEFYLGMGSLDGVMNAKGEAESRVTDLGLFVLWLIGSAVVFSLDRYSNKSRGDR